MQVLQRFAALTAILLALSGCSSCDEKAGAKSPEKPTPEVDITPTNIKAEVIGAKIKIEWDRIETVESYDIERCLTEGVDIKCSELKRTIPAKAVYISIKAQNTRIDYVDEPTLKEGKYKIHYKVFAVKAIDGKVVRKVGESNVLSYTVEPQLKILLSRISDRVVVPVMTIWYPDQDGDGIPDFSEEMAVGNNTGLKFALYVDGAFSAKCDTYGSLSCPYKKISEALSHFKDAKYLSEPKAIFVADGSEYPEEVEISQYKYLYIIATSKGFDKTPSEISPPKVTKKVKIYESSDIEMRGFHIEAEGVAIEIGKKSKDIIIDKSRIEATTVSRGWIIAIEASGMQVSAIDGMATLIVTNSIISASSMQIIPSIIAIYLDNTPSASFINNMLMTKLNSHVTGQYIYATHGTALFLGNNIIIENDKLYRSSPLGQGNEFVNNSNISDWYNVTDVDQLGISSRQKQGSVGIGKGISAAQIADQRIKSLLKRDIDYLPRIEKDTGPDSPLRSY